MAEVRTELAPGTPIEVWFQDEMRVGQKNKLTYRWARKGSRPRAIHDQRTQSTYLFGAVCPERGVGAALVLPTTCGWMSPDGGEGAAEAGEARPSIVAAQTPAIAVFLSRLNHFFELKGLFLPVSTVDSGR